MSNLVNKVDDLVKESEGRFASTIAQYKWELIPQAQLHAAKMQLTKSDYIMKIACGDPEAVYDALQQAAILGLDLTQGLKQAWLVPRKNQQGKTVIQLQPGYKGVEATHQRLGVIDRLTIRVVRENDEFEWSGDDTEKPIHKADWFKSDEQRGKIIGAYCITYFPDGAFKTDVTSVDKIFNEHRNVADSWKSYQVKLSKGENAFPPPWVSSEEEMVKKSMIYIAAKQWPANYRNRETASRILETLHEVDTQDYSIYRDKFTPEQKEAFDKFIESNDQLGLFLFSQYIDRDAYIGLFNSFPKGQKVKGKDKVREMEKVGSDLFSGVLSAVSLEDPGLFSDSLEGIEDITYKLLLARIPTEQKDKYNELLHQYLES